MGNFRPIHPQVNKRVLHDVLCLRPVPDKTQSVKIQLFRVRLEKRIERTPISFLHFPEQN